MLEYIEKLEGVIGALLGVIATLVTTKLLKYIGGIRFYLVGDDFKFNKFEETDYGETVLVPSNKLESDHCNVDFVVEIYNNSEMMMALRDLKICFYM